MRGSPCAGQAETLKVAYGISLVGLPLGSADLSTTVDGSKYKVEVGAKLTGLAGLLVGGKGAATPRAPSPGPQPQPVELRGDIALGARKSAPSGWG